MFYVSRSQHSISVKKRFRYTKRLLIMMKRFSGRSNVGRLVFFGRGGGYRNYYRIVDFKRTLSNIPGKVLNFEYDPNRNMYIMLVLYLNGTLTYLLAPKLMRCNNYIYNNNKIVRRKTLVYKAGNSFSLFNCTTGSFIHCLKIDSLVSKYARAAGTCIQLIRKVGQTALLRFPSKEERFVNLTCFAVLGRLANGHLKLLKYTSAGYMRRIGHKPHVRGVAKNPIDHPHGGGEGRTTAGQPSVTPWGFFTKGIRTTTRFVRFNLHRWGFFKRRNKVVWS